MLKIMIMRHITLIALLVLTFIQFSNSESIEETLEQLVASVPTKLDGPDKDGKGYAPAIHILPRLKKEVESRSYSQAQGCPVN
jgi:hypothetical protein